jgi:hypothetical protein
MTSRPSLSPTQVATLLVPRFLAGEKLSARDVQTSYGVTRGSASRAITMARNDLRDQHNAVLPIANYHGGFDLAVTRVAVDAYYGEQPQVRDTMSRLANLIIRLTAAFALDNNFGRSTGLLLRAINNAADHIEIALEQVDAFISDRKDADSPGSKSA